MNILATMKERLFFTATHLRKAHDDLAKLFAFSIRRDEISMQTKLLCLEASFINITK